MCDALWSDHLQQASIRMANKLRVSVAAALPLVSMQWAEVLKWCPDTLASTKPKSTCGMELMEAVLHGMAVDELSEDGGSNPQLGGGGVR